MTRHDCDLCGSDRWQPIRPAKKYMETDNVPGVCMQCGFVYVRDRRTAAEIAASWTKEIFGEGYSSAWPAIGARLGYVADWVELNMSFKGKSVFEIGAGEGRFLDILKTKGAYPVGLEPSKALCAEIKARDIAAFCGTVESMPPTGSYEAVAILWTLENCVSPMTMLRKAREWLTKDGHIVVATGSRILVPFKKPMSCYFSKTPADTHATRWSANTLRAAMETVGFDIVATNLYGEHDVLCVIGKKGEPSIPSPPFDRPQSVLTYFHTWHNLFP